MLLTPKCSEIIRTLSCGDHWATLPEEYVVYKHARKVQPLPLMLLSTQSMLARKHIPLRTAKRLNLLNRQTDGRTNGEASQAVYESSQRDEEADQDGQLEPLLMESLPRGVSIKSKVLESLAFLDENYVPVPFTYATTTCLQ